VNTLEPTYFRRALEEYHDVKESKVKVEETIAIDANMLNVLKKYIKTSWKKKPLSGNRAAISALKVGSMRKKRTVEEIRKRRTEQQITLKTTMSKKIAKNTDFKDVFKRLNLEQQSPSFKPTTQRQSAQEITDGNPFSKIKKR